MDTDVATRRGESSRGNSEAELFAPDSHHRRSILRRFIKGEIVSP